METLTIDELILKSIEKGINYTQYRQLVKQLVETQSTSGIDKTEALINYTSLNDRRMNRWDKTIKISEDDAIKIKNYKGKLTWVILTESWCGDAAHVIPVLNKISELNPNINLKLVFRDENDALMTQYLTLGARAIPKLIVFDDNQGEVVGTYGPRPSEATKLVNDYKTKHGKLTPEFKEELQHWYNKNKGQNIVKDIIELLDI
jgi:thiol-disulfide isomerase/thioredoxin